MKINIMSDYLPLKEFLELLNSTSNLKDVYLLCHQAGCPVYVIRDINDKCSIIWHPYKDSEKNIIKIVVKDNILNLLYSDEIQQFDTLEDLRKDKFANPILGDTPFDINYLVWSKDVVTH